MASFVRQLYMEREEVPPTGARARPPDGPEVLQAWLSARRGTRVTIAVPERGAKRKLMEVVTQNAAEAFHRHKLQARERLRRALAGARRARRAPRAWSRRRCASSATTSPTSAPRTRSDRWWCSRTACPKRADYRRFQIKGVAGQDDFASMEEMLRRRFTRLLKEQEEGPAPGAPLLLSAGAGRGGRRPRVSWGWPRRSSRELDLQIPHVGLAKRLEEVYFPDHPEPL